MLALMLLAGIALRPANAQQNKVGPGVVEAIRTAGEAHVMIALKQSSSPKAHLPIDLTSVRTEVASVQADVLANLYASEYRGRHQYQAIPAMAGTVTEAGLSKLVADPNVLKIDLDIGGSGALGTSVPLVRAYELHDVGVTGQGVVVAVLDTGLDTDHDDLSDNLVGQECFLDFDGIIDGKGKCPNGSDRQSGAGAAEDDHGHGTNVTGIITSKGTISSIGVAPDAEILAYKVLDNDNRFRWFSDIVAALDDIINNHPEVDVINMSVSTDALFNGNCDNANADNMAGAAAINTLRANGVVAFASSGNNGSGTQMTSPACLSNVVSVGATDDSDNVAEDTNSNATTDIMAPGMGITSTGLNNGTSTWDGTSQASAHAAGYAALFIDAGIATTPNEIETLLESSSVTVTDVKNGLSFPRIDYNPNPVDIGGDIDGIYWCWDALWNEGHNLFDPVDPWGKLHVPTPSDSPKLLRNHLAEQPNDVLVTDPGEEFAYFWRGFFPGAIPGEQFLAVDFTADEVIIEAWIELDRWGDFEWDYHFDCDYLRFLDLEYVDDNGNPLPIIGVVLIENSFENAPIVSILGDHSIEIIPQDGGTFNYSNQGFRARFRVICGEAQPVVITPHPNVTLTFGRIVSEGETTATEIPDVSQPPPANFFLCDPPIYYDITTSAVYEGDIEVCISYQEGQCEETDLRLFHLEPIYYDWIQDQWMYDWVDVTTSVDTDANIICGTVSSLSEFLLVAPLPAVSGDLDGDGDVDRDDLNIILAARNTPADGPDDPKDLDGDGMITALDARKLVTMCTRPRCATE